MSVSKLIRVLVALVLLLVGPAKAEGVSLTGTVTYRERIALPADARLQVTLVEMARATPVVGASSIIPASGSVPIGFMLNVRTDILPSSRAYGLLAEISSEGRVMFRNSQPVPIDVHSPAPVSIVINFSPDPPHDPPPTLPEADIDLVDVVWTVTSIGGRPVIGDRPLTLSIAADHRVGGSGGCNNYFTEASVEASALTFGPAAATRMACGSPISEQETAYFAALAAVASYELDGVGLRLLDAAGVPLVGLVRATE